MSCRKGVWKFDTLCEHPLDKGEATCHSSLVANTGRAYPLGGCQVAICENCISIKQITAFTTNAVALPEPREPANVQSQNVAVETCPCLPCVACAKGDNTVGHWIRWCHVPIVALRNLTNDATISSLLDGSRRSKRFPYRFESSSHTNAADHFSLRS